MSESTGRSRRRKALSATLAVAMVATMLISGTYAFYSRLSVTNHFSEDLGEKKEVIAHDDFIEGENKDVYVENTGETDVYVRVKLTETFILDGKTIVDTAVHQPDSKNAGKNKNPGVGGVSGDTAAVNNVHYYFTWTMGRAAADDEDIGHYFLSAKDPHYQDAESELYQMHDGIAQDLSGKEWAVDSTWEDGTAAETMWARNCSVYTMKDYLDQIAKQTLMPDQFYGWVIDKDGWAYWTQKVEPNMATGLLLNHVAVDKDRLEGHSYSYDIKVDVEAVDDTDLPLWLDPNVDKDYLHNTVVTDKATPEAINLLQIASKTITEAEITQKMTASREAVHSSKGAMRLYEDALRFVDENPMLARKLATRGDIAQQVYAKNPSKFDKVINDAEFAESNDYFDPLGWRALQTLYGDGHGGMTRDQALGVWAISDTLFDEISLNPSFSLADDFRWMTAEYFPNLFYIELDASGFSDNNRCIEFEPVLRGRIEYISISSGGRCGAYSLDLDGFDALTTAIAEPAIDFAGFYHCPSTIQVLVDPEKNLYGIYRLPDLRVFSIGTPYNYPTTSYAFPYSSKLQSLSINKGKYTQTEIGTLDLRGLEELQTLRLKGCTTIEDVRFPTKQTILNREWINTFVKAEPAALELKDSGLVSLDISGTVAWDDVAVSLAGLTKLQLASRREDQQAFTDWNTITTGTDVYRYECKIDKTGTAATYKKYGKDGSADVTYDELPRNIQVLCPILGAR